jgi:hypothetical protein
MMDKELINVKIDKKSFSVVSLSEPLNDNDYWLSKTATERIKHIERLRRINYGYSATARLQRIFEFIEA